MDKDKKNMQNQDADQKEINEIVVDDSEMPDVDVVIEEEDIEAEAEEAKTASAGTPKKKKRVWPIVLAIVILLPSLLGATYYARLNNALNVFNSDLNATPSPTLKPSPVSTDTPEPSATVGPTPEPTAEPTPEPYQFKANILNVLLLGLDGSTERYDKNYLPKTDTMMLLAINFDENKVDIISFPRDSYIRVPVDDARKSSYKKRSYTYKGQTYINDRINAAFAAGGWFKGNGFDNVKKTVSHLMGGIPIHYYAAVDMNVVKNIIDIMGGLNYDVDIDVKICGREVKKGMQKLSGQEVLDYSRVRKGYGGDLARADRQQRIVMAVMSQLKSADSIMKIPEYYEEVSKKTYTDLNLEQIAALALFANKLDMEDDITRCTMKTMYVPRIDGKSILGVDLYDLQKKIKEIYGVDVRVDKEMDGRNFK